MNPEPFEEFEPVKLPPPTAKELNTPGNCYICGTKRGEGRCPAYHGDDSTHLLNRKLIHNGLPPIPIEPVNLDNTEWGPCWQCGAPTDREGRCTRVMSFNHDVDWSSWMEKFHSKQDAENAPPVTFLIKDFLQCEGVTGLAAPVRERKSLIALNIVHALLTGEKLFDHFEVVNKPERVLYLCPEVSLGPFTDRVKRIGLLDYVGQTFFYRTMSADGHLDLSDEALRMALPGSVVFLDTAIRFLEGDENSSKDVRAFADKIFSLLKGGAEAVVLIHHSPKDMGDHMTLESAMRGSGDMGAFLACCWGTRLQDPEHPYRSESYLENLKQRDFESKPFEVTCGEDCRMHIVGDPTTAEVRLKTRRGNPGNKDGKDAAAEAVVKANPDLSLRDLETKLAELDINRRRDWIAKARARINAAEGKSGVRGSA